MTDINMHSLRTHICTFATLQTTRQKQNIHLEHRWDCGFELYQFEELHGMTRHKVTGTHTHDPITHTYKCQLRKQFTGLETCLSS